MTHLAKDRSFTSTVKQLPVPVQSNVETADQQLGSPESVGFSVSV